MARRLIECVPNFSEGRDPATIQALLDAVEGRPGVALLDRHSDPDHNRTVLTFAGSPEEVVEAAVEAVGRACALIDMNVQEGVHPRVGAADVVPFVPLEGVSLEECARIAAEAGEEIWRRFQVPVYLYESAARTPERTALPNIRRGEFKQLMEAVKTDAAQRPDIGGPMLHPTAGAVVVGARRFLVAFNVNLATADVEVARQIASAIRTAGGGLPAVRALGVPLPSKGASQVTMNLLDFWQTSVHEAFRAVEREASRRGAAVADSEIVGLLPRAALGQSFAQSIRCSNFSPGVVLEDRLEQALLQSVDSSASLAATLCAALAGAAAAGSGSGGASHPEFDRDREFFENERKASIQARGLDSSSLETALVRAQELCSRLSAMAGHAGSDLRWTAAAELAGGALRALLRLAHPPGPNSAPGGR